MEHKREVKVPATTKEEVYKTTCDLCNNVIQSHRGYDFDFVSIEREQGTSYPSGGSNTVESFDVCPSCWESILLPILGKPHVVKFPPKYNHDDVVSSLECLLSGIKDNKQNIKTVVSLTLFKDEDSFGITPNVHGDNLSTIEFLGMLEWVKSHYLLFSQVGEGDD